MTKNLETEHPATWLVHWPSGPVYVCNNHKDQLVALSQILGCHVGTEMCSPDKQCSNCKNEAKLK